MMREPIQRLLIGMFEAAIISKQDYQNINDEISQDIISSWQKAIKAPYPTEDKLLTRVYCNED